VTAARYLALALALAAGGRAVADVMPPIWAHHSSVTTVLELAEPLPDYVFYRVRFFRSYGRPGGGVGTVIRTNSSAEPVSLDPDHPTRVTGDRSNQYSLYAIPGSIVAAHPSPEAAVDAVNRGQVPEAAELSLGHLEGFDAPTDQSELVLHYRVERKPGGGMAFVPVKDGPWALAADPRGRFRWATAGTVGAIGVAGIGLWWVRRRRNGSSEPGRPPMAGG
jgi:hypothetical protein